MKTPYLAVACLIASLSCATQSSGAEGTFTYGIATSVEMEEVATAIGFCRSQALTAHSLGEASQAKSAALDLELARLHRATGEGCKELEIALKAYIERAASSQDEADNAWSTFTNNLDRALTDLMRKQHPGGYDEVAADQFVSELSARSKGKMDQEILGTILSASREFRQYPERELSRGFREIFATSKLPKARGVRMQLKVPVSWKSKDGDGPHVVQKWTSRIDISGAVAVLILIAIPTTPDDIEEIGSALAAGVLPDELRQVLPMGVEVEATDRIQLMFKPALRATVLLRSQLSKNAVVQKNYLYFAQTDGGIVSLQCGVATVGDASELPVLLKRYERLCEIVASSMLDLSRIEN